MIQMQVQEDIGSGRSYTLTDMLAPQLPRTVYEIAMFSICLSVIMLSSRSVVLNPSADSAARLSEFKAQIFPLSAM